MCKLSQAPSEISHRDWSSLLAAGWTEQQAAEAVHIVGIFEYLNRLADALGLESHGVDRPMLLEDLHVPPAQRESESEER